MNFVKEIVPDGAKTVAITRDEISKIKRETGRIPAASDDAESKYAYLDRLNAEKDEEYDDEEYEDEEDDDYEDDDYEDDDYDEDEGRGKKGGRCV